MKKTTWPGFILCPMFLRLEAPPSEWGAMITVSDEAEGTHACRVEPRPLRDPGRFLKETARMLPSVRRAPVLLPWKE